MSVSSTNTLSWDKDKHDEVIRNFLSLVDNNASLINDDVERIIRIRFKKIEENILPDEDNWQIERWYSLEPGYFSYSCYCSIQKEPFYTIAENIQKANPNIEFTLSSWGDCMWASEFYDKYLGTTLLGEYEDVDIWIFDKDEDERFLKAPDDPIANWVFKKPPIDIPLYYWDHDISNIDKIVIDKKEFILSSTGCDNFDDLFEWCKTEYLKMHPELDKTTNENK